MGQLVLVGNKFGGITISVCMADGVLQLYVCVVEGNVVLLNSWIL